MFIVRQNYYNPQVVTIGKPSTYVTVDLYCKLKDTFPQAEAAFYRLKTDDPKDIRGDLLLYMNDRWYTSIVLGQKLVISTPVLAATLLDNVPRKREHLSLIDLAYQADYGRLECSTCGTLMPLGQVVSGVARFCKDCNTKICAHCGSTKLEDDGTYCSACGAEEEEDYVG